MTRVGDIRVETLAVPFREPLVSGARRWHHRRLAIIRLLGDSGSEGLGEVAAEIPAGYADAGLRDRLVPLLGGIDLADGPALHAGIRAIDAWPSIGRAVRSGVATAAWDLRARAEGRSVAATMVPEPRTHVSLNGLIGVVPPEDAAAAAAALVEAGFGCLKLKGGGEPAGCLEVRLRAVRERVGAGVELRLDLNGTLDPTSAKTLLDSLAEYDLAYVEQPIPADLGPGALAALRRDTDVPIAADEAVTGPTAARALIEADAVDVLVVKLARVGGLPGAHEIARLATDADVPIVLSTLFETGVGIAAGVHMAAALPLPQRAHGLATAGLLASDLLTHPLGIEAGTMQVPAGPGLGVSLDPLAVGSFRVA